MKGDFDRTSKNGKPNTLPINQKAVYTVLSHAKSRDELQLINFESEHIKVNNNTLQEILRLRKHYFFGTVLYWRSLG